MARGPAGVTWTMAKGPGGATWPMAKGPGGVRQRTWWWSHRLWLRDKIRSRRQWLRDQVDSHGCFFTKFRCPYSVKLGEKVFVCLLLFYAITTVFQCYHGSDMMYEMIRRKHDLHFN